MFPLPSSSLSTPDSERSQKGNGDDGKLIPKYYLKLFEFIIMKNIPAWKVCGFWNPGNSPHSQCTLLPPPTPCPRSIWTMDLLFSLLVSPADGTRIWQPVGLELDVKGFISLKNAGVNQQQCGSIFHQVSTEGTNQDKNFCLLSPFWNPYKIKMQTGARNKHLCTFPVLLDFSLL